ncbi:MAG TPA: CDP-alcohol phosphatidyltransferase family protein [Thermoplasmata archaeon]|nr:CDP-alcohol phosphatidyltransferase family protein [Thermoplasmata archaeon]
MTDRWRIGANLATLGNGLLGVGAIAYTLAGNPIWAMLLLVCAIAFDGLDGLLSRRSTIASGLFGRVADSVADGISYGLAPAVLVAVHGPGGPWSAWTPFVVAVAAFYAAATFARLVYFTVSAHEHPYFLGVPSPQAALAVIVALLFHDVPAFQSVQPIGVLVGVTVIALLMVVPIPYPKIRRGSPLRIPMAVTAAAAVLTLVPLQFRPAPGSGLYELAYGAAFVLFAGVASYYLLGPFTVRRDAPHAA